MPIEAKSADGSASPADAAHLRYHLFPKLVADYLLLEQEDIMRVVFPNTKNTTDHVTKDIIQERL